MNKAPKNPKPAPKAKQVIKEEMADQAANASAINVVVEELGLRNPLSASFVELQHGIQTNRSTSAVGHFVWSTPKSEQVGKYRSVTRESVGEMIKQVATWLGKKGVSTEGLGVCETYDKRANVLHAHFCFVSGHPHNFWGPLANIVLRDWKRAGRWQIALPEAGPSPETNLMHYLLVPTTTKWRLDMRPQKTTGFVIPRDILEARRKGYRRLTDVAASPDDVFSLIWSTPSVGSLHDFQVLVGEKSHVGRELDMDDLSALPYRRMGKFLSSHARSAQIVQQSIDRRNLARHHEGLRKTFRDWLGDAAAAACECKQPSLFFRQLQKSQKWHDKNAMPRNQIKQQMKKWLDGIAESHGVKGGEGFTGREQNLYFKGPPGCGKSTFCQAVMNLLPEFFIGSPCYDSSTPWSGLRKWQVVLDLSEFQPTPSLNASQVLVLLERKEKGININVKGQVHFTMKGADIPYALISSNELNPVQGWKKEQFEAVETRCMMVNLQHALPQSGKILVKGASAVHATCRGCSGKFCNYIMSGCKEEELSRALVKMDAGGLTPGQAKDAPSSPLDAQGAEREATRNESGQQMHAVADGPKATVIKKNDDWKTARKGEAAAKRAAKILREKLQSGACPPPPKKLRASSLDDPFGDDFAHPWEVDFAEHDVQDEELAETMAGIDAFIPSYTADP